MERWLQIVVALASLLKMMMELPIAWTEWRKRARKKKKKGNTHSRAR